MRYEIIFIIMFINVLYVSFFTLRMILVIKGYRLFASLLSVIEVFVYLKGLTIVLDNLDNSINLAAYCIGWGMGVYLGSKIEEYLALGYVTLQVVVDSIELQLPSYIREQGFGVTSWTADGKDGKRLVMQVLTKRSNEQKLLELIHSRVPKAFVISYEPKQLIGGFWVKQLKGRLDPRGIDE
ncbi:DUF2179 domain-containing protein [Ferviditalea candida]|uniref:UPF0316 protein VF724_02795 n=1 Tax=Ferviditalea candida TaxID=3108399 RepID=A0ABU5ZDK1_9BACL|nr:DUF2179 domain-containing protein [Paenibacillaceae bacterium T2]